MEPLAFSVIGSSETWRPGKLAYIQDIFVESTCFKPLSPESVRASDAKGSGYPAHANCIKTINRSNLSHPPRIKGSNASMLRE